VLGQRARLVYPGARLVGVEVRGEERHAARHYDQWIEADYLAPGFGVPRGADLVVSNPGFSITVATVELALDRLLRPGGWMLLFARKTWGESAAAAALLERRLPRHHWLVHRRLAMSLDPDDGVDNCNHVWWAWRCGDDPSRESWDSRLLPALPSAWCDYVVRPGDEASIDPLPRTFWP
jgi:hypothetical protein